MAYKPNTTQRTGCAASFCWVCNLLFAIFKHYRSTMLLTLSCMFRNPTSLNSEVSLNLYLLGKWPFFLNFVSHPNIKLIFTFLFPCMYHVYVCTNGASFFNLKKNKLDLFFSFCSLYTTNGLKR